MKEAAKENRYGANVGLGGGSGPRYYITGVELGVLTNKIRVKNPGEDPIFVAQVEVPGLRKRRLIRLTGESALNVGEEVRVVRITTLNGVEKKQTYYIRPADYPVREKPFLAKTRLKNPFKS